VKLPKKIGRRAALASGLALAIGAPVARAQSVGRGGRGVAERPPLPASPEEHRILEVLEEIDRNQRWGNLIVPVEDGRLLRVLAEAMGARRAVELGTSVGYSAIWLCLGLRATGGRLTTFDLDARRLKTARENFERARVAQLVTPVLGDAHVEVARLRDPIDLLFIDADKEGYLDYLTKVGPLVRRGGLIVAHNMHSPPPDPRYLEAITANPALETVFLNMQAEGIGLTLKKR